jgi:hypothetical protein
MIFCQLKHVDVPTAALQGNSSGMCNSVISLSAKVTARFRFPEYIHMHAHQAKIANDVQRFNSYKCFWVTIHYEGSNTKVNQSSILIIYETPWRVRVFNLQWNDNPFVERKFSFLPSYVTYRWRSSWSSSRRDRVIILQKTQWYWKLIVL